MTSFPFTLKLLPVQHLHPHEITVSHLLKELKKELLNDKYIKNPIIVDEESLTVLDGMHRLKAIKELGLEYIPACLHDYNDKSVKLGSWCRKLVFDKGKHEKEQAMAQIKQILEDRFSYKELSIKKARQLLTSTREDFLIINPNQSMSIYGTGGKNNKYWRVHNLEEKLKDSIEVKIEYIADKKIIESINEKRDIFLIPPSITKQIVLKHHKENLFPPKTTRHVFSARPLFLNVPFSFLKGDKSLKVQNKKFERFLKEQKVKKKKGKKEVEGRLYEEKRLYFFKS